MNTKNKRLGIVGAALLITVSGVLLTGHFVHKRNASAPETEAAVERAPLSVSSAYGGGRKDVHYLAHAHYTKAQKSLAKAYFAKIVKDPKIALLYKKSKTILGSGREGDGAARWITLGVLFSSSDGYGDALHLALQDANSRPEAVLARLKQGVDRLRPDPFLYEMAMNMTYQLDLDPSERGAFFGQELEYQLSHLSNQPNDSYWVSVMGLLLAKQAGVKSEVLKPYLSRGLANCKGSPAVMNDFKKTVLFHYEDISI